MRSNPWQGFAGLRLSRIPDETTILNFRHFLEHHGLGERLLQRVFEHLQAKGLMLPTQHQALGLLARVWCVRLILDVSGHQVIRYAVLDDHVAQGGTAWGRRHGGRAR